MSAGLVLIGQYDSPFVRRVAVAMHVRGTSYEHWPWSTFGDADRLIEQNPLCRVPVLLAPGGPPLIDSAAILDYLDEGASPMLPAGGQARREALHIMALGTGLAEKAVSLVYEHLLHPSPSAVWVARCGRQMSVTLHTLEQHAAHRNDAFWFGATPGHADIAVACAVRFLREAHPTLLNKNAMPALQEHANTCEALPAFRAVIQNFIPPA